MPAETPIAALRSLLKKEEFKGALIRISDPYLSEYIPDHWSTLRWLTGFTGSAGTLFLTANKAALQTDSRYWEQAERQLEGTGIEILKQGLPGTPDAAAWFASHLDDGAKIGASAELMSLTAWRRLDTGLAEKHLRLKNLKNPADTIWLEDRPPRPQGKIRFLRGASRPVAEKLAALRSTLKSRGRNALLLSSLDEIAWLTNCRGSDVAYNPVFLAAMIVTDREAFLFTEPSRMTAALRTRLAESGVTVLEPEAFKKALKSLRKSRLWLDPDRTPAARIKLTAGDVLEETSPVTIMKSRKTPAEIASIKKAMKTDGIALCEFYAALDERLGRHEKLTECDAADMLLACRVAAGGRNFLDLSFDTIAAFGRNAALPHYSPVRGADALLTRGLLLIDSGAQYTTGTTDITRMTPIGTLTKAEKRDVTLVLKGMIALACAKAPEGTAGAQLDAFAREPLWKAGLDFGHGTGHGVGYILNVHEGPFHISPRAQGLGELGLAAGIVVSDEPGLYRPGIRGIRIENLLAAKFAEETPFGRFIAFDVLTLCPIDVRTLDASLMTAPEIDWLNAYHRRIEKILTKDLSERARAWLTRAAAPLRKSRS